MKAAARHLFTHGEFSAFYLSNDIANMVIIRKSTIALDWKPLISHEVYEIPNERAAWAAAEAACSQYDSDRSLTLFPVAEIPAKETRTRRQK